MRCSRCEPDYCACADFYAGRLDFWKGEMMARPRINPHAQGSAEHVLFSRWRQTSQRAAEMQRQADAIAIEAGALRAKAEHYAKALDALGCPVKPRLLEGPKV